MKLRMFEILNISQSAPALKVKKLPIKAAYNLAKILAAVKPEVDFYQAEFEKVLGQYGVRDDNNNFIFTDESRSSIKILPGKEEGCQNALTELLNLEVELDINAKLNLEDLEHLEMSVDELSPLMSFIQE